MLFTQANKIRKNVGERAYKTERDNRVQSGPSPRMTFSNCSKYGNCRIKHLRICQAVHTNATEKCKQDIHTHKSSTKALSSG